MLYIIKWCSVKKSYLSCKIRHGHNIEIVLWYILQFTDKIFDIPSKPHTLHIYHSILWTQPFRSSPRPISNSQLHALRHFHLCPIYLVVFKGSYRLCGGYLILRGASRLDAFSVYPFPTWLPGCAIGMTTGAPEVSPTRSSRTKVSSSQISYAHAG